jgi:hypothetical protein
MPRASSSNEHESITSAVKGLLESVSALVDSVHAAVKGPGVSAAATRVGITAREVGREVGHAASAKSAKLKSSLKSYWARLTPEQKKARVEAILRGRGLLPKKGKRGPSKKGRSAA